MWVLRRISDEDRMGVRVFNILQRFRTRLLDGQQQRGNATSN